MGPWYLRDPAQPFRPGCSYAVLVKLVEKGRIGPEAVIRGPTTHQFWSLARRVPGVAHRLGICHSCQSEVEPTDFACRNCQASFAPIPDRQHLGLMEQRWLPGHGDDPAIRAAALGGSSDRPAEVQPVRRETPAQPVEEALIPDSVPRRGKERRSSAALIVGTLIIGGLIASAGWWLATGPSWLGGLSGPETEGGDERIARAAGRLPEIAAEPAAGDSPDRVVAAESPAESEPGSGREPQDAAEGEPSIESAWSDWETLAGASGEPGELRRLASELRGRRDLVKVREAVARRAALLDAIGIR